MINSALLYFLESPLDELTALALGGFEGDFFAFDLGGGGGGGGGG